MTPAEFWVSFWRWAGTWVGITVLALVALFALVGALWGGGVILAKHNATANYQIQHNGVQYQSTNSANIVKGFNQLNLEAGQLTMAQQSRNTALVGEIKVEEASQAGTICFQGENVSGVPLAADQQAWLRINCLDGAVAPTSQFYIAIPAN
jgi:hypothetical protein